jgi:hypothetical protein
MDAAEWLRGVGLEKYMPAFRANDIDGAVLRGSPSRICASWLSRTDTQLRGPLP